MLALARKFPEPPRKANYQNVLDAPENMVAQIIDGELYLHARPVDPHLWAGAKLFAEIEIEMRIHGDADGEEPEEWTILPEPELRLGNDVLVPDIAGWRAVNLQRNRARRFADAVPDWVFEVLSPTTRHIDLGSKSDIYARDGVSHLWIIDPEARTLQVSAHCAGKWLPVLTLADAETASVPPFEKYNNPLSRLWAGGPLWPLSG